MRISQFGTTKWPMVSILINYTFIIKFVKILNASNLGTFEDGREFDESIKMEAEFYFDELETKFDVTLLSKIQANFILNWIL